MNIVTKNIDKNIQKYDLQARFREATKYVKEGKVWDAISIYEDIVVKFPKNAKAKSALKSLKSENFLPNLVPLIEEKKFDDVEQILLSTIERDQNNHNFWKLLGIVYYEKQDYSLSMQCYQKALDLNPNDHDLMFQIGIDFLERKDVGNAFKTFKLLNSIKPGFAGAYTNLGIIYDKVQKFDKAKNEWLTAIKNDPRDTVALSYLGINAVKNEGDYRTALKYFETALEYNPEDVHSCINMATAYFELGEINKSLNIYEEWEKRNWADVTERCKNDFRLNYSLALFCAGHVQKGWSNFGDRVNFEDISPTNLTKLEFPMLERLIDAEDKKILILMEQGVGDQLFFLGLLKSFQQLTKSKIIIQVEDRLSSLISYAFPHFEVTTEIEAEKLSADFWLLCGDLGKILNFGTDDKELCKPYLKSDKIIRNDLRGMLSDQKLNVGFVWRSGLVDGRRMQSYTLLEDWENIIRDPDLNLISLQYGDISEDLETIDQETMSRLKLPAFDLKNDFRSLASLITSCDLVFGPSTAPTMQAMAHGIETLTYGLKGTDRWAFGLGLSKNEYKNRWYRNCSHFVFSQSKKSDLVERIHAYIRGKLK